VTIMGPVIAGFDGTASGEDAIALARACARVLDATLIVTTVHPAPAPISSARVDAEWVADRHHQAEKVLDGARRLLDGGDAVEYRVVASSSAAHGLHDLADAVDASAIVVGSSESHAGREPRLFAGSTADRLLAGSRTPVGIAPPGLHSRDLAGARRFGVAYVDTPDGRAALAVAEQYAARVGGSLTLYSVLVDEAKAVLPVIGRDGEHAFAESARESFQGALDTAVAAVPAGIAATGRLLTGEVVELLADIEDVDVLFCGSRGYGPARRILLGGVSSRLVRRARSAVIVVPRGA
jgi:nucleotide-binding universal stress UspA family protein